MSAKRGVARKRRPVGSTPSMRQGEREGGSGARLLGREGEDGLRGEVRQGVGAGWVGSGWGVGVVVVVVLLLFGGRKAASGLRMEVNMSLVRSMMAGLSLSGARFVWMYKWVGW